MEIVINIEDEEPLFALLIAQFEAAIRLGQHYGRTRGGAADMYRRRPCRPGSS